MYIYNAEKRYLIKKLKKINYIKRLTYNRIRNKTNRMKYKVFRFINLSRSIVLRKNPIFNKKRLKITLNQFLCKQPII